MGEAGRFFIYTEARLELIPAVFHDAQEYIQPPIYKSRMTPY